MYLLSAVFVETMEDNYETGELGTGTWWDTKPTYLDSIEREEILKTLQKEFDVVMEDIEWNADEPGEIRFSYLCDEGSYRASKSDIDRWAEGKKRLWSLNASCSVKKLIDVEV